VYGSAVTSTPFWLVFCVCYLFKKIHSMWPHNLDRYVFNASVLCKICGLVLCWFESQVVPDLLVVNSQGIHHPFQAHSCQSWTVSSKWILYSHQDLHEWLNFMINKQQYQRPPHSDKFLSFGLRWPDFTEVFHTLISLWTKIYMNLCRWCCCSCCFVVVYLAQHPPPSGPWPPHSRGF